MYSFTQMPSFGRTGNLFLSFQNTDTSKSTSKDSGLFLGNYDSDDDDDDYDPDEDLRMIYDKEDYDEMHEAY